jgi:hypothetical protein
MGSLWFWIENFHRSADCRSLDVSLVDIPLTCILYLILTARSCVILSLQCSRAIQPALTHPAQLALTASPDN